MWFSFVCTKQGWKWFAGVDEPAVGDKMSDPGNGSLACKWTVLAWFAGTVCHRRPWLYCVPCSHGLAELCRLVFPLTVSGSIQGTMGRPAQQLFVCPLCGQSLFAMKPNTPSTPLQNCHKNLVIKTKWHLKIQWSLLKESAQILHSIL